ncbi:MAG: hypothetical protein ACYDB4_04270 [Candidatus Dormibacteraceae bacterium]
MGEKGLMSALQSIPPGYEVDPDHPGRAKLKDPLGRPGPGISWNEDKGAWTPPGFKNDPSDRDRIFNSETGQNGVWDEKAGTWVDAKSGEPIK